MRSTPGRAGVTYEAVSAAAEALVATGGRPTLRKVRERLGTGSLGTIQKHLGAWQDCREPVEAPRVALSAELTTALLTEIGLHSQAARAEGALELAEVKSARDELAEELERKVGELETQTSAQAGAIVQLRADAATSTKQIGELTRDLARAELQLEQLPPLQREIADLQGKLQTETGLRQAAEHKAALLAQAGALQNAARIALETRLAELQDALKTAQQLARQLAGKRRSAAG